MTARVLVVDDILSNVKLLEAKLTAEYFDVVTAFNGLECLARMEESPPDIVLLDVMMPGMDGFEVCRRIKSNPKSAHVPVVMVTALDQPSDRVAGLEAGADDFLTKPVDDAALFARVRSLVRLKMMTDELRMRETTGQEMGLLDPASTLNEAAISGRILIIEDRPESVAWFASALQPDHSISSVDTFEEALVRVRGGETLTTDGPYTEGKEHLGGLTIINAEDLDAALRWGTKLAEATTLPIEVRPFQNDGHRG